MFHKERATKGKYLTFRMRVKYFKERNKQTGVL